MCSYRPPPVRRRCPAFCRFHAPHRNNKCSVLSSRCESSVHAYDNSAQGHQGSLYRVYIYIYIYRYRYTVYIVKEYTDHSRGRLTDTLFTFFCLFLFLLSFVIRRKKEPNWYYFEYDACWTRCLNQINENTNSMCTFHQSGRELPLTKPGPVWKGAPLNRTRVPKTILDLYSMNQMLKSSLVTLLAIDFEWIKLVFTGLNLNQFEITFAQYGVSLV